MGNPKVKLLSRYNISQILYKLCFIWICGRNVRDAFRIQDNGDEKREIVVDLYYNTLMYAKDNNTDFVSA